MQQEELMEKRREVLEKHIEECITKAKQCLSKGNKSAAQLALKRKAMYMKQLETVENNIMRLSEQRMLLEQQTGTVQTVAALQEGARAQKATMAEFKIDKVDKVMEDIQEAADAAAEVQEALAMPLGLAGQFDEDELEAEIADLEQQQLDEELLAPAPIPSKPVKAAPIVQQDTEIPYQLPSAPTGKSGTKSAEDEIAELEAELSAL